MDPLAAGPPQPTPGSRGACGQLLLKAICLAVPLSVPQQILKTTSFLFDSRNEEDCFVVNYIVAQMTKKEEPLSTDGICAVWENLSSIGLIPHESQFPVSERSQGLLLVDIPLFSNFVKPAILLWHLLPCLLANIQKEPCAISLPPHLQCRRPGQQSEIMTS